MRDEENLHGLVDKIVDELNIPKEILVKQGRFSLYLRHLYKAAAPTQEHLADDKYVQFVQDLIDVYGLLHARYIRTAEGKFSNRLTLISGMAKVMQKYLEGTYGTCPRALCNNTKCIPVGLSDKLRGSRVKIFCPKCDEVYMVQRYKAPTPGPNGKMVGGGVQTATSLDGAFFGSSFPQMFLAWN